MMLNSLIFDRLNLKVEQVIIKTIIKVVSVRLHLYTLKAMLFKCISCIQTF